MLMSQNGKQSSGEAAEASADVTIRLVGGGWKLQGEAVLKQTAVGGLKVEWLLQTE